jgi:proteasome lid subunit RPN8/RPN11
MKLIINPDANKIMQQHATEIFPDECCGFLYGSEDNEVRTVVLAEPVVNTKEGDKKRRFEISPLDYIKAEQQALKINLILLGVYHSHPQHPAIASEHDLKQAMPYFSYIILSVLDREINDIKSWILNEENTEFIEEEILNKEILIGKHIHSQ